MEIYAEVIRDSIGHHNRRLTTLKIKLPKVLLAEFNTHRVFSRNFASSRAIPNAKFVELDSFEPRQWLKNQSGMQAKDELIDNPEEAQKIWVDLIEYTRNASKKLTELGVHKQWANRPNDWHAMVEGCVTATDFDNFDSLRIHPTAQPEMCELAAKMRAARSESIPKVLKSGEWHIPFVYDEEIQKYLSEGKSWEDIAKVGAARICRVSYNKLGQSPSFDEDIDLFNRLANSVPIHASPLESVAMCVEDDSYFFNIRGFQSYRWLYEKNVVKSLGNR